jgi:putative membrane protein
MSARTLLIAGLAVLLFAWAGPLPGLVPVSFSAHMWLHMTVVGVAVPLIAAGLAPRIRATTSLALPIAISVLDLVVVWGWHVPALHHASRTEPFMLAIEQLSFFGVSLLVWLTALGAPARTDSAMAGALTLFFTSMHMTLLGALLGLAPRPIYHGHHAGGWFGLTPIADQQVGGVVMLAIGGVVYMTGGLILMARVLGARASGP